MNNLITREVDLGIIGGTVLTMDADMRVLENHCIAIDKGRILDIQPGKDHGYSFRKSIDATGCIVMPGLVNAHSHLPMTYFRGLADDLPLSEWLQGYIWPLEAKLLDSRFIHDAALHGAAEMIKNGITTTQDMYFDMGAIASACREAGLRAIIAEAALDLKDNGPGDGVAPGTRIRAMLEQYSGDPLISFNVAPHSIYACNRATLERCVAAAAEMNVSLHIHLSETRDEVQNCLKATGLKPVFYLKELGFLDHPAVFAHGVWVDEDEMELLADAPASIAMCTESNLKLASGILPLKNYLQHGVNVCFATDGVASNNDQDLLAEMDTTAKLHKAINNDPAFLPAKETLRMATVCGAKALGVDKHRGTITMGKDADLCVLSLNDLQCQPLYNPYSHVVYAMGSRNVRDVVIAGEVVLENSTLTKVDEAAIIATAKEYRQKITAELHR
jgi:5-methylthioadenosine/S-adenosylhomocysteine deaminase